MRIIVTLMQDRDTTEGLDPVAETIVASLRSMGYGEPDVSRECGNSIDITLELPD